jgi:hypothetical protein
VIACQVSVGKVAPGGAVHGADPSAVAPGVAQLNNAVQASELELPDTRQVVRASARASSFATVSQFAAGVAPVQAAALGKDAARAPVLESTRDAAAAAALGNPGALPAMSLPLMNAFSA